MIIPTMNPITTADPTTDIGSARNAMTDKQKRRGVTVWEIPRKAEFMHALRKGAEEMHWPVSRSLPKTK